MIEPEIHIVDNPISLSVLHSQLSTHSGARVEFSGVVRDDEAGVPITGIDYEAFREMALEELRRIADELIARYDRAGTPLDECVCIHRVGFVPVSEAAVYIRTAARHRREAFEANEEFIAQLKRRVPIWKHPVGEGIGYRV